MVDFAPTLALLSLLSLAACIEADAAAGDDVARGGTGFEAVEADLEEEEEPTEALFEGDDVKPDDGELPLSARELELLVTLAGDDERSRATIVDRKTGVVATYRVGDFVDGVQIEAIEAGSVVLRDDSGRERLEIGHTPIVLDGTETFYPDLAEDDDRSGSMADAVQMVSGPGFIVKTPAFAWGTPKSVTALRESLRRYAARFPDAPDVHVGDLSKRGGGPFPPHLSHQSGRDVDIGYVLEGADAHTRRFVPAHRGNLDRERTWGLIEVLWSTGKVAYIFMDYEVQRLLYEYALDEGVSLERLDELFQYPRGSGAMHGKIRDWKGHDDHFHVRLER